jgi:dTDP-4-amino-4,6-dideoxygalactose transaminase
VTEETQIAIPFVDLGLLHGQLRNEIDEAIRGVVDGNAFVSGPDVAAFEREFADYCEARYCVGTASGTAALHLAFVALDIGPGDEVIVPANTFVSTVMPLLHIGAQPVLVDCDPDAALIDVGAVETVLSERTKAIVPVHLYGQPADLDPLLEIAERHGIKVIEDAAQAHGARYRGRRVGALGHAGCFSFYPAKNLGGLGDGGAVITNDASLAEGVRLLRDLGQETKYRHVIAGFNERLDTLQAAVLRVKLRHLDGWNASRREAAGAYAEALANLDLLLPGTAPEREHVWHLYVARSERRDQLRRALGSAGVQTGLHYPVPIHLQDAFARLGYPRGSLPTAEAWSDRLLSLPMFPGLNRAQVEFVCEVVEEALSS